MDREYKFEFVFNDIVIDTFTTDDKFEKVKEILDQIDDSELPKTKLRITTYADENNIVINNNGDAIGKAVVSETESDKKKSIVSETVDVGSDLKEILIKKYGFKDEDIEAQPDTVKLFDDDSWIIELSGDEDLDETAQFLYEQAKDEGKIKIAEKYVEDAEGEYTIWSASDLIPNSKQIPLVKIKTDENGDLFAETVSDSAFDMESYKIAQSVIDTAKKSNKSVRDTLIRIDKTLNHNDPFFSVEIDRSIAPTALDLLGSQALRTLRDDLKAAANLKSATEETITDKYMELTGVNYYTGDIAAGYVYTDKETGEKFTGKEQYNIILGLMNRDPRDKHNYISPEENPFIQRLKDLTEDLIEKVLLKNDPDFYEKAKKEA